MKSEEAANSQSLSAQMLQMATGHFLAQAIHVAAKLGIADLLKDGPKSVKDLAKATGAKEQALYRLLRALASVDIFAEEEGMFLLTPLATTLQTGVSGSIRDGAILLGQAYHWGSWGNLLRSVMTGQSAFEHTFGKRFFVYLMDHPEAAAPFHAWMTQVSEMQIPGIIASYDFSPYRKIVDVGGGHGSLLAAILKAHPHLQGILYDLPNVIATVPPLEEAGVKNRCQIVPGDFFELVPAGCDLYVLKSIIHDWNDDLAVKVLFNCRNAMIGNSKLLVIEMVVPPGNTPHPSKFMDLNMLVLNHGGRERAEAEFHQLFQAAGLRLTRISSTPSPICLLEGARL